MKILISSGSRGEWGYYTPIMKELNVRQVPYDVMFHNMAPVHEYGNLAANVKGEISAQRTFEYYSSFHGDKSYAMAKNFSALC